MRKFEGAGVPIPPPPKAERWSIVSPKVDEPLEVVVLGNTWLGIDCHWWTPPGKEYPRSTICLAPQACVCLSEIVPDKWHGYLAVLLWKTLRPGVLSLTQLGVDCIIDAAGDVKGLRGQSLVLYRQCPHKSSKISARVNPKVWRHNLPPSFDLLPSLVPVYGAEALAVWKKIHNLEEAVL